ncbi:hypothetical protein [Tissierella creatinophila]|nr:hypothetical protein [Tissierella creatinophila]
MPKALEKICQKCKQTKKLDEFFHNSTKSDYHNGICKECQKQVNQNNKK